MNIFKFSEGGNEDGSGGGDGGDDLGGSGEARGLEVDEGGGLFVLSVGGTVDPGLLVCGIDAQHHSFGAVLGVESEIGELLDGFVPFVFIGEIIKAVPSVVDNG